MASLEEQGLWHRVKKHHATDLGRPRRTLSSLSTSVVVLLNLPHFVVTPPRHTIIFLATL